MAELHTIYFYILRNIGGRFTNVPLNITLYAILIRVKKYKIGNLKIKVLDFFFFFFAMIQLPLKLYGCCLFSCCRKSELEGVQCSYVLHLFLFLI